jgi:hypothetical protein
MSYVLWLGESSAYPIKINSPDIHLYLGGNNKEILGKQYFLNPDPLAIHILC